MGFHTVCCSELFAAIATQMLNLLALDLKCGTTITLQPEHAKSF